VAQKSNKTSGPKRLRRASWLALLSLAWLQVSFATHQFDHVAAFSADSCHVCVQLDRVDDVVADQSDSLSGPRGRHDEPAQSLAAAVYPAFVRHFESRAPPAL
jgi:hypothetical protein